VIIVAILGATVGAAVVLGAVVGAVLAFDAFSTFGTLVVELAALLVGLVFVVGSTFVVVVRLFVVAFRLAVLTASSELILSFALGLLSSEVVECAKTFGQLEAN